MVPKICSIPECGKPVQARTYCNSHYLRAIRHGHPLAGATEKLHTPEARFAARTKREGACLIWTAGRKTSGYGKMLVGTKSVPVHRWAYEQVHGPIPDGMQIDHMCHNRLCCEVSHLRVVTHKQNAENHQGPTAKSTTGVRGVWRRSKDGKYVVEVKHNKRSYHGGFFDDLAAAEASAVALRNSLFTHNDIDRGTTSLVDNREHKGETL